MFTVDEGDHFVGDAPTPPGCDGVNVRCTYSRVGEINADLRRMLRTQFGDTTAFSVHSDDAPTVYINGNPSQTDPVTRNLERETAHLNWLNPYTNSVENNIMVAQADRTEMKTLHMVTADPLRTPTYTPFAVRTGSSSRHLGRARRTRRARRSRRGRTRASRGTTATSRTRSRRPGSATSGPA